MKRYGLILVVLTCIFTLFAGCSNNSSAKSEENKIDSQDENSLKEPDASIDENTSSENTNQDNTQIKKEDLTNHKETTDSASSSSKPEKVNVPKQESSTSKENAPVNSKNNSAENSNSKNNNTDIYKSPLGFSIGFPNSWKGLYTIDEDENSLSVYFKQIHEGNYGQGLLFTIQKKTDDFDETLLDSVGTKRYIVAKDTLYVIGGPTDVNFSPDSPDFSTFQSMHDQSADIVDSIKITN